MILTPENSQVHYPKVGFNHIAINVMPRVRPWVAAAWSATFPGFGHFYLDDYLRGFILVVWEVGLNLASRLNEAIVYTFTGRFDLAREVFVIRLGFLYTAVYIFCIWDSYHIAVDYNKLALLAEREHFQSVPIKVSSMTVNYWSKKSPAAAAFWSLLIPGLGQLYCRHLLSGVFKIILWTTIVYHCRLATALNYMLHGSLVQGVAQLDPRWFLFLPSVYFFSAASAYQYATYSNRALEAVKITYLQDRYPWQNFQR